MHVTIAIQSNDRFIAVGTPRFVDGLPDKKEKIGTGDLYHGCKIR
jgi:hypothetical protein